MFEDNYISGGADTLNSQSKFTFMKRVFLLAAIGFLCSLTGKSLHAQNKIVVFQTDFGVKDGAVSAMKGVANGVSLDLKLYDLTHEIPAYNVWEAAYRLEQTVMYWPSGTVFVSVVDPGVGTNRKSVVVKTRTGHYIVTPDNGTLTFIASSLGIETVREIDETVNRRKGSEKSYTFHGRDVYAYTAARLASGQISFEQVGKLLPPAVVIIPYQKAVYRENRIIGNIPILDIQYGNIWTNIDDSCFRKLNIQLGDSIRVIIKHRGKTLYNQSIPFAQTFGAVASGKTLAYQNSLMNLSFAINQGNFSENYHIYSGNDWEVSISRR